jgi:hypothetical protein
MIDMTFMIEGSLLTGMGSGEAGEAGKQGDKQSSKLPFLPSAFCSLL